MSPTKDKANVASGEPLTLTLLPFVGLGALTVLAIIWQFGPERDVDPPQNDAIGVGFVDRWEQQNSVDISIDPARDYTRGADDAAVTIVAFSDFQCPYCSEAAHSVEALQKIYEGDIRLVFKNFPIDITCNDGVSRQLHPLACRAAAVARCAGAQQEELFWEVHDAFFAAEPLSEATLVHVPMELDVSIDELNECVQSLYPLAEIKADIALGRSLSVSGTPVLFINGKRVDDYRRGIAPVVRHILGESP